MISIVLLVLVASSLAQQPTIAPPSYTAFLDPSDVSVRFTCTGEGFVSWMVDGKPASETEIINRGISTNSSNDGGNFTSQITIPATVQNNNTEVQCFATLENRSEVVSFKVQGLLAPPPNLTIVDNDTSIKLVWSAPFTLDVSGVDPDISTYTICNNITSYCSNTSGSGVMEHVFPRPFHYVEFRVSAVNGAGQGSESSVVYESDGGFSEVDNETVTVTVTEPAPTSATTDEPTETTTPSSMTNTSGSTFSIILGAILAGVLILGIVALVIVTVSLAAKVKSSVEFFKDCFNGCRTDVCEQITESPPSCNNVCNVFQQEPLYSNAENFTGGIGEYSEREQVERANAENENQKAQDETMNRDTNTNQQKSRIRELIETQEKKIDKSWLPKQQTAHQLPPTNTNSSDQRIETNQLSGSSFEMINNNTPTVHSSTSNVGGVPQDTGHVALEMENRDCSESESSSTMESEIRETNIDPT